MLLGKVWTELFCHRLWVNSRVDIALYDGMNITGLKHSFVSKSSFKKSWISFYIVTLWYLHFKSKTLFFHFLSQKYICILEKKEIIINCVFVCQRLHFKQSTSFVQINYKTRWLKEAPKLNQGWVDDKRG